RICRPATFRPPTRIAAEIARLAPSSESGGRRATASLPSRANDAGARCSTTSAARSFPLPAVSRTNVDWLRRRQARSVASLHDDRAVRSQRRDRTDGGPDGQQRRADHAERQRDLDQGVASLVANDQPADVALVNE